MHNVEIVLSSGVGSWLLILNFIFRKPRFVLDFIGYNKQSDPGGQKISSASRNQGLQVYTFKPSNSTFFQYHFKAVEILND